MCLQALDHVDPFVATKALTPSVLEAIEWQARRTAAQVADEREQAIVEIERLGQHLWRDGTVSKWFAGCDDEVARVSKNVNGPLLAQLAARVQHCDVACAELFRQGANVVHAVCPPPCLGVCSVPGAPLTGTLEASGIGRAVDCKGLSEMTRSPEERLASNAALLAYLGCDDHESELHRLTVLDASLGRMSAPIEGSAAWCGPLSAGPAHTALHQSKNATWRTFCCTPASG